MKRFHFQLDTVLGYKQQVLEALTVEHGAILARVRKQEELLRRLAAEYRAYDEEYSQKKLEGMSIAQALQYQSGLHTLELRIRREEENLRQLHLQEEEKRAQVVEAKKDTTSIERLREMRLESYNKAILKEEEAWIDELVSAERIRSSV